MSKFETTFFEYLSAITRYLKVQPLNLGGTPNYSGGIGGPPGGYIGYLPQTRVAYDVSEAESMDTPGEGTLSGASLLDNLNHIRYRIAVLEDGYTGVAVMEDGTIVASGVTVLNFENAEVEYESPDRVNITISTEIYDKYVPSGIYGENLTPQVGASGNYFVVSNPIYDDSLRVYVNGLRQASSEYTIDSSRTSFITDFIVYSGDTIYVDYDTLVNDTLAVLNSGVSLTYLEENYYNKTQVDGFLLTKSDTGHTHTESEITDLSHDADYLKGIPIASGFPSSNQALIYNAGTGLYEPTDVSTSEKQINQQFIFTVEGSLGDAGVGLKPLRVYSHDTNGYATIDEVFLCVNTPPSGSSIRVNVLKNGVSIFDPPEYVEISDGSDTGIRYTSFADDSFNYNDYFQIYLTQVDSYASDLTVHIRFHWVTS